MTDDIARLDRAIKRIQAQNRKLVRRIEALEAENWGESDSPKGESVPGVRH